MVREERKIESAIEELIADSDTPAEVEMHDDKTRENRTPGFSRMRFNWNNEDQQVIQAVHQVADNRLLVDFSDAYEILNAIYEVVRDPQVDENGEIMTDRYGFVIWSKTENGSYQEDFSRLSIKEKEHLLHQITVRLFAWEQKAAGAWADAMFAKAQWEERFALAFKEIPVGGRKTDESMMQQGRIGSREERYYALFESYYSRKADALVRSMDRIALRLSQSLG